ncbi:hypothetical protein SLS53_000639 [Cytospora paraplurivora]|uniref:Acetyl esterase n=1 Tax=Cytospora paraplurivora TaxID=2898453 RepID=A0AAN9UJD9_9PEZI
MRPSVALIASILAATTGVSCASRLFQNLVTFGDSYTDNGRLAYYIDNNGNPPPAGTLQQQSNVTSTGGYAWGQFVQQSTGAAYFDYAISGATCSNEVISRYFPTIKKPFPSVVDDELPSFLADVEVKTLYLNRTVGNTVYALWIGTNDLGFNGFLTDSQASGEKGEEKGANFRLSGTGLAQGLDMGTKLSQTNITTYIDCVWSVFDAIYSTGGRRFVLLNTAPLQFAPAYASQSNGGVGDNQYWTNKTLYNQTEYQYKLLEYTQLVNRLFVYGVAFETLVKARWPGATIDVFDVNSLMTDIYENPSAYLEAPANVTGYFHHCEAANNSICANQPNSLDTFLWYDELHPSIRTGE